MSMRNNWWLNSNNCVASASAQRVESMIVLDANILIRAVLGRRVRQLIEKYAARGVQFSAPDAAFDDARKYLPALLKKRGIPEADILATIDTFRTPSSGLNRISIQHMNLKPANACAA